MNLKEQTPMTVDSNHCTTCAGVDVSHQKTETEYAGKPLQEWAIADLAKSGISAEAAAEAGMFAVSPSDYKELLGFNVPGISDGYAVPFRDPSTGEPMKTPDGRRFSRVKLREPVEMGDSLAKYLSPKESGTHAYIPPCVVSISREAQIVITEGEKKALCACLRGIPTIGLTGVWGFQDAQTKGLHADLDSFIASNGKIILVIDSDAACNFNIALAVYRFDACTKLRRCSMNVLVMPLKTVRVGSSIQIEKVGMDDYIMEHGADKMQALLSSAQPVDGTVNDIYYKWLTDFARTCATKGVAPEPVAEDIVRKGFLDKTGSKARRKIMVDLRILNSQLADAINSNIERRLREEFTDQPVPEHGGENLTIGKYVRVPGYEDDLKLDALDGGIAWCSLPNSAEASRPFPRELVEVVQRVRGGSENGSAGGRPRNPSATEITNAFMAQETFCSEGICLWRHLRGTWYLYETGYYKKKTEGDVDGEIMKFLRQHPDYSGVATTRTMLDIRNQLKAPDGAGVKSDVQLPVWVGPGGSTPAEDWRAFRNRLVNINALVRSINGEVVPEVEIAVDLTPTLFSTSGVDYEFDPSATCPKFDRFLAEILPDPKAREVLQMMSGLCLDADTSYNVFFILFGPAGTGKSTFLHVLTMLVGPSNVCHVLFSSFREKFSVGQLTENLINLIGEGDTETAKNFGIGGVESILKDVTDGGLLSVEKKFSAPYTARATARCVIASNMLPTLHDKSDAIWDRQKVIPFEVRMRGSEEENPNLRREIETEEMPGVFNWAMQGLAELRKLKSFPETKRGLELKNDHRATCDHEKEFLEETFKEDSGGELPRQEVYRKYRGWMTERNYHPLGEGRFNQNVARVFPGVTTKRKRDASNGQQVRVWTGLRVQDGADEIKST